MSDGGTGEGGASSPELVMTEVPATRTTHRPPPPPALGSSLSAPPHPVVVPVGLRNLQTTLPSLGYHAGLVVHKVAPAQLCAQQGFRGP